MLTQLNQINQKFLAIATHVFVKEHYSHLSKVRFLDTNNEYKVTRQRENLQPPSGGGITIRDRDWHFKNYSGKWSSDGKSIQVQTDGLS